MNIYQQNEININLEGPPQCVTCGGFSCPAFAENTIKYFYFL